MIEAKNVDSILFNHPTQSDHTSISETIVPELSHNEPEVEKIADEPTYNPEPIVNEEEISQPIEQLKEPESEVNDYGIEVSKKPEKTYTQAEVNEMIRERLSRGKFAEQQPQYTPQQQQVAQDFQHDPTSTDSWEVQLEGFIENSIAKRENRIKEQQWQQQAQQQQAEFEIKFNNGASKYSDFEQVVQGKPLTPQMVMATRGMSDPAAFIYAAAKNQEAELGRIAQIQDPMTQAVELGKLEERMRKARPLSSRSPKPISNSVGDVAEKAEKCDGDLDIPIDQRINQYGNQRMNKKMGR